MYFSWTNCNLVLPAHEPLVSIGILQADVVENVDNIERALERAEKIKLLVDKTNNLRFQAVQPPVINQ